MRFIFTSLLILVVNLVTAQIRTVERTSTPLSNLKCSKEAFIYSPNFCDEEEDFKYYKWDAFTGLKYQKSVKYSEIEFYLFKDGKFRAIIPYNSTSYSFGAKQQKPYFFIKFQFLNKAGRLVKESKERAYIVNCGSGNIEIEGIIDNNLYTIIDYVHMVSKGCFFTCR